MFDFSMTEIAVFGVVALLAIGPKDLPVAMRAVSTTLKKARRMASEFQGHVDEMMRESNLGEVTDHIRDIRNFNIAGHVSKVLDPEKTLANVNIDPYPETVITRPDESDPLPEPVIDPSVPAFIPPGCVRPAAPAFVPPQVSAGRK